MLKGYLVGAAFAPASASAEEVPYGRWATLPVWLIGLMTLFRLDFWEVRILFLFNWGLNFLVRWFLFAAISAWVQSGG